APDPCFDFSAVPPVRPTPRLGMYVIFPTDPGYFSLLDQVHGHWKEAPPKRPWGSYAFTPGSAFDLDYRYVDSPDYDWQDFFDPVKRIHLGDNWLLSFGGQAWIRTMKEVDSRLTAVANEYELVRTRLH